MKSHPFVPTVVILNYHRISENTDKESLFSLHPRALREQLQLLKEYQVQVTGTDMKQVQDFRDFTVALSFDDGNESDHEVVMPLLKEFGYTATFFPIVNHIGKPGSCNWNQIRQLTAEGFDIGSHGLSHEIMLKQDAPTQEEEFTVSKKILEDQISKPVTQFAFPFGRHDDELLDICQKSGYSQALTTGLKVNKIKSDTFLLFRWNITSKTSTDLLRQVISSSGVLSPAIELTSKLNQLTRKNQEG